MPFDEPKVSLDEDEDRSFLGSLTAVFDIVDESEELGDAPRDWRVERALICVAIWDSDFT